MNAGIVLFGGNSVRMGTDKGLLPFGAETMVARVARLVAEPCDDLVVVGRREQEYPAGFRAVRDLVEGQGPLAGLVYGLEAVRADLAFLASCDTPLMRPAFVRRMFELAVGFEIAVPVGTDGRLMPIGAVYARSVLPAARRLLDSGKRRLAAVAEGANARLVQLDELEDVDPDLESLFSCNTPEAYREALARAGLTGPE